MFGNDTITKVSLLTLLVSAGTGCNKSTFASIDPQEKSKLLAEQYVLDNPYGQDSGYGQKNPNGEDPGFGTNTPSGQDPGVRSPASINPPVVTQQPAMPPPNPVFGAPPPATPPIIYPTPAPLPPVTVSPPPPSVPVPPSTPPSTPTVNQPSTFPDRSDLPPIPSNPTQIPLFFMCSTDEANSAGETLVSASNFKIQVTQYTGGTKLTDVTQCYEDDPNLIAEIKSTKQFHFKKCAPKGYLLNSSGKDGRTRLYTTASQDYFTLDFIADGKSITSNKGTTTKSYFTILFDANANTAERNWPYPISAANQVLCDDNASPLFVDMRSEYEKSKRFTLTAPWAGVWFNILGQNADVPNSPNRISWFDNAAMAYIVLPNSRGQVLGIDQLFGDNTRGPDGKFASNGYEALAKYDSNSDGVISSEDTVYSRLKIWQDRNHDGKATASEMKSLSEAGLAVIDLHYDSSFAEKDIYGNTVKYKSVAKTTDGGYRLVFDVWFELNLYKASQRFSQLSH